MKKVVGVTPVDTSMCFTTHTAASSAKLKTAHVNGESYPILNQNNYATPSEERDYLLRGDLWVNAVYRFHCMGYRVIKELPGAPVGTVVTTGSNINFTEVYKDGYWFASIPKAELDQWIEDTDRVKKIKPIKTYVSTLPDGSDVNQFVSKINELVAAYNKLTGV